jgi:hypothetical protein
LEGLAQIMSIQDLSSTHVLEIRFQPMGSFLDMRGRIADFIKSQNHFAHWQITENRVDFSNLEKRDEDPETAYVAFRNCGYQVHNPSTHNYFSDRGGKFINLLGQVPNFRFPSIQRFGVRGQFFTSIEKESFGELKDEILRKSISSELQGIVDAVIDDFGITLDCRENDLFLKLHFGPMKKDQFVEQFSKMAQDEAVSKNGFFMDVDCHKVDLGEIQTRTLIADLKQLHQKCWDALEKMNHYFAK